jgi:hypothetical protein
MILSILSLFGLLCLLSHGLGWNGAMQLVSSSSSILSQVLSSVLSTEFGTRVDASNHILLHSSGCCCTTMHHHALHGEHGGHGNNIATRLHVQLHTTCSGATTYLQVGRM